MFSVELTQKFNSGVLTSRYHSVLWGRDAEKRYMINGQKARATVEGVAENGRLKLRLSKTLVQSYDIDEVKWIDPN